MAKTYADKAGQYAKGRSRRALYRTLGLALTVLIITGIAIGLIIAPWAYALIGPWLWVATCLSVIVFAVAMRRVDHLFEKGYAESYRWLRGGRTEALVFSCLKDLPDGWHVFNNVQLQDAKDIDHIVVGPNGVFAISTKSHRGLLTQAIDGTHLLNGTPTKFIAEAQMQALFVRDRLEAVMRDGAPFVHACLVVPFMYVKLPPKAGHVFVINDRRLTNFDEIETNSKLSKAQVQRIAEAIELLAKTNRRVYKDCPVDLDD